jgi:hypothetical protein
MQATILRLQNADVQNVNLEIYANFKKGKQLQKYARS